MHNHKINIYYTPKIDNEEKEIFKKIFGKDNILFGKYKTKGVGWGTFDVQIIIDTLNDPVVGALIKGGNFSFLLAKLIKLLFNRNNKKIEDDNTRFRYTTLIIRLEKKFVVISNTNKNVKITISETSASSSKFKDDKYSKKKLNKFLNK
ncbi:hypothetical protein K8R61_02590 [bacterium]|nr:hypothetical protein [bacterium]